MTAAWQSAATHKGSTLGNLGLTGAGAMGAKVRSAVSTGIGDPMRLSGSVHERRALRLPHGRSRTPFADSVVKFLPWWDY